MSSLDQLVGWVEGQEKLYRVDKKRFILSDKLIKRTILTLGEMEQILNRIYRIKCNPL